MGRVTRNEHPEKLEFEGEFLFGSSGEHECEWYLRQADGKIIEFVFYKPLNGYREDLYGSKIKVNEGKVYVDGEPQFFADGPRMKKYDKLKLGKLTQSEFKNGQMYITMEDFFNNNEKTELVYPGTLNGGEPYDGKERYVRYSVQGEHQNIYISKDYINGTFGHDYYPGSRKHLKQILKKEKQKREQPDDKLLSEHALEKQIESLASINEKLKAVRDTLEERKPNAFYHQGKSKVDDEKRKRIRKLSPEHQEEIKKRKVASKAR